MAKIPVPGGSLYFSDHGEGRLIVLLHGVGGNHAIWFHQMAMLSRSYRVVALDHRGFGLSIDDSAAGRAAFADDLLALLDHLEVEKATLIGQSMGGGTAITFAGLHPDRVAALVVASSLHALIESDSIRMIMDQARAETGQLGQLDRVLSEEFRRDQPVLTMLYREITTFNATRRQTLTGEWRKLQTPEELGAHGFPILFIAAAKDRLFPIQAMRLTQARVAGSFLVEIDQAGHSAFFERPNDFNDSVLSFLQSCGLHGRVRPAHSNQPGYVA